MLPNCEQVTVWEISQADAVEELDGLSTKRHIFHIDFVEGVTKECRAVFFGETYRIISVSDSSKRLRGLELQCVVA
jgi:Phage head-tail joining protein